MLIFLKFTQTLIITDMKKLKIITSISLFILLLSCKIEPQAINYGKDACHFCKMNIVDKQHAAQYVTKKGKQFKFDAIECMVNDVVANNDENSIAKLLVADFGTDGNMVDATTATYLICKEIKSPMGAFLSAFSTNEKAMETQKKLGGDIYTWTTLKDKYTDK